MVFKALAGLAGLALAAAAAAYAATVPERGPGAPDQALGRVVRQPAAPEILSHPDPVDTSTTASFRFSGTRQGGLFQCRLDSGLWSGCESPVTFRSISAGRHSFRVRTVVTRRGSGSASRYAWLRVEPKRFTVYPRFSGLDALYPGAAPVGLPIEVRNPNPIPIVVTRLRVRVARDPAGCDSTGNIELTQPNVSPAKPLRIPAGVSVRVPSGGALAPTIRLRDLPVNQDACQGARFPLAFSGSAHG